jgi:hypothetical protein
MKLTINYYNIMRQITGKSTEMVDFDKPITIREWLEWFITKYRDRLIDIYIGISPEKLFSSTTLFVNKQVVFSIQDILCKDLDLHFFSTVSGG